MLKTSLSALALVALLAGAPVFAQDPKEAEKTEKVEKPDKPLECTDEKVTKFQARVDRMQDAAKKEAANKEMTTAKDLKAKGDSAGCLTHMTNARKIFKGLE